MGRMDEEQAVFEQLTLSDFKKWISTTLTTFNNNPIICRANQLTDFYMMETLVIKRLILDCI